VSGDQVADVTAYLEAVITHRDGAWWHAQRRYQLRRFAGEDVPRLGTPERLQLLSAVNALRPSGLAPIAGPELDAYLARATPASR
jgi:hypothetical protein